MDLWISDDIVASYDGLGMGHDYAESEWLLLRKK